MFEETASAIPSSSLWESMNSWFTPTVLFVLLNVMIGTIAITSSLTNHKPRSQTQPQNNDPHHQKIARSPSVLQRLKSINFYSHYRSQEPQDNLSLRNKPSSNSDTLFHLQNQLSDTQQSHYFFQETSHENGESISQAPNHYLFEQTHQHTPQETQTHYIFDQTHVQNPQETQTHYSFDQTHIQNLEKTETNFDFKQTHVQNLEKTETHFDFERKDSILDGLKPAHEEKVEESDEFKSMDEVYSQLSGGAHFNRTKSDTEPSSGAIPAKLPAKMRKSASLKSAFGHFQEEEVVEARRPATVRERGGAKLADVDEEVDARADDFINKFKQQLKLQRLDSIIRYKDMIGRRS